MRSISTKGTWILTRNSEPSNSCGPLIWHQLAFLAWKTFLDSDDYEIIQEGYKAGHGCYYMYVFKMKKVIGVCPWGYPTNEICVYFSWKEAYGDKFRITAYPFSCAYHFFLKRKKQGMTAF